MPTRIAHLSDLHYGASFDAAIWETVTKQVRSFAPHLLIVSGDLVDVPTADGFRAVKRLLNELSAASGAGLFVVPGNHDVSPFGIDLFGGRSDLFYRIFKSEDAVESPDGTLARGGGFRFRLHELGKACFDFLRQALPRSQAMSSTALRSANHGNVLLALIDSNSANQKIRMATGSVSNGDLLRLDGELADQTTRLRMAGNAHLVRIAVLHHHVLPVAHTGGRFIGAEPFMVLHNAGDLLAVLARHKFDIILHGHRHRAQIVRIDPSPDTAHGSPILVAAAGSAARRGDDPVGNSFNQITIENNGRIIIESIHYGDSTTPNQGAPRRDTVRRCTESIENAKLRAFSRASERAGVSCREEVFHFNIDELGDLTLEHRTIGLRALGSDCDLSRRPHTITLPERGEIAREFHLDEISVEAGYGIDKAPVAPVLSAAFRTRQLEWFVILPQSEREANYTVRHSCSNSIVMTRWEAGERARCDEQEGMLRAADWDQESVGCHVRHPIEKLNLELSMPRSLDGVFPYLCCERPAGFPNFPISQWGDADLSPDMRFVRDTEMDTAEGRIPYHDKGGIWRLTVKRPVVGYRYRLRWTIPGGCPEEPVPGETEQWRQLLLHMADNPSCVNDRAQTAFSSFADRLRRWLAWGGQGENWRVELFVYDASKLVLRTVARRSSKPARAGCPQFSVGPGNGIAGAAFLKRVIVPWARKSKRSGFAKPVLDEDPEGDFQAILAVPLFHPREQDNPRPSPWGTIGVVCFSSSSSACKVPRLLNEVLSIENQEMMTVQRGMAGIFVHEMFGAPGRTVPPSNDQTEELE
ncbi:MAG: metallophosphoesterase [Alphaproteobacteria bacterium]|nr:metallophosphoesterase [Alphaproteobacteria bacterium]